MKRKPATKQNQNGNGKAQTEAKEVTADWSTVVNGTKEKV